MRDPIQRQIEDARVLLYSDDKLGRTLIDRLVPVFCRGAIEAAYKRAIQRRRLGRGDRHEDVEDAIRGVSTNDLVALALFDDAALGGQVLAKLGNRVGPRETDSYKRIKDGVHGFGRGRSRARQRHGEDRAIPGGADMSPRELTSAARSLIDDTSATTSFLWARAAAVLARRALE